MPVACDPNETWEYVLECDRDLPKEQQTVFTLKPLTLRDEKRVMAMSVGKEDTKGMTEAGDETLRAGLVGWRNLNDVSGTEIAFQTYSHGVRAGKVTDECLHRLTISWRGELVGAILERNKVTEDDRKN